jgi:hypothetical protein
MNMEEISNLTDKERYGYLINHINKQKEIWLLQAQDGLYAMFEDDNGQQYIPIWPEKKFADSYAEGDWEGYESERMVLHEFLDWMQELQNDQIMIGAFPNSNMQAIPLEPLSFKKQLIQANHKLV